MAYRQKYEVMLSELSEKELSEALSKVDVARFTKEIEVAIDQVRKEVMD